MSIEEQLSTKWQHVIVVGQSEDDSLEFAQTLVSNQTTIIEQNGLGIYSAMNEGWKAADGEWVCFLNSGDYLAESSVLGKVNQKLQEVNSNWCVFSAFVNDGKRMRPIRSVQGSGVHEVAYSRAGIVHNSVLMRKDFIAQLGGYRTDLTIASDYDLMLRAAKFQLPAFSDLVFGVFNSGGISTTRPLVSLQEARLVRREVLDRRGWGGVFDFFWTAYRITRTSIKLTYIWFGSSLSRRGVS